MKLQAAIEAFDLGGRIAGARALDVGASTGGFTDVLLRRGAAAVTAIEVGHGQLVDRLRQDPRVTLLERTDFKTLSVHTQPGPFDFFTVDVSFVAARNMLRRLAFRLRVGAHGVVLVKPHFELPGHQVKRGQVSDPALRARALDSFRKKAERLGFVVRAAIDSPVAGGEGTVEILTHLELVERGPAMPGATPKPQAAAPRTRAGRAAERWFVVAAPGLEQVVRAEVEQLPGAREVAVTEGGVDMTGGLELGMAANLRLRAATRVLLRVGEVKAREFSKLRRLLAKLPWERWLATGEALRPVRLQVSAHGCRLYHTGAVAETVLASLGDRLKVTPPLARGRDGSPDDGPEPADETRILVRGVRDVWTLSMDASGELLHRRGWRAEAGAAPLRETLAAGLLALAGYDPARPLLDPMCGAGTIALEAAALARGQPPGQGREFAFERWPSFDRARWQELRAEAVGPGGAHAQPPIWAWDRDGTVIEKARRNAERAGMADAVHFAQARFAAEGGAVEPAAAVDTLRAATGGQPGLVISEPALRPPAG